MEENEVVRKLMDFLADLRCGDMSRGSLVRLDCCDADKRKLEKMKPAFERMKEDCTKEQQKLIEDYMEQQLAFGFSQQQEAYCQGIVDAIRILNGLHLLKSDATGVGYSLR